jgi:hypothetical protein
MSGPPATGALPAVGGAVGMLDMRSAARLALCDRECKRSVPSMGKARMAHVATRTIGTAWRAGLPHHCVARLQSALLSAGLAAVGGIPNLYINRSRATNAADTIFMYCEGLRCALPARERQAPSRSLSLGATLVRLASVCGPLQP